MNEPGGQLARAARVHMVGIGGSGMAALATLLLRMGKTVTGSDLAMSSAAAALGNAGAVVHLGHRAEHIGDAEYVIRSSAVSEGNPEVSDAVRRGVPSVKLAEAVGELMRGRQGVAVAGTHGKTTTTALVAWLLDRAGLDPLALIGADSLNFGASARPGAGPMVVEADEYDRRFLQLSPKVAVVTSVEPDHLDYFRDLDEIRGVFHAFVEKLPPVGRLVVCADDPGASQLQSRAPRVTYGFGAHADWRASDYTPVVGGGSRFMVESRGGSWLAESSLVGEHNARNALAALAAAAFFGVGVRSALDALPEFLGTRRRFETRGRPGGVWVVDDYAHHPTAVAATLRAARGVHPNRAIWAVFQPHTTNRTAALLDALALSFSAADHVLILPIYQPCGRETVARPVTSRDLAARIVAANHPDARVAETFDEATELLVRGVEPGDMVLIMGAGDVTLLSDRLLTALDGRP